MMVDDLHDTVWRLKWLMYVKWQRPFAPRSHSISDIQVVFRPWDIKIWTARKLASNSYNRWRECDAACFTCRCRAYIQGHFLPALAF